MPSHSPVSSPSNSSSVSSSSIGANSLSTPAIIGTAIGVTVLFVIVILVTYFYCARNVLETKEVDETINTNMSTNNAIAKARQMSAVVYVEEQYRDQSPAASVVGVNTQQSNKTSGNRSGSGVMNLSTRSSSGYLRPFLNLNLPFGQANSNHSDVVNKLENTDQL